MPNKCRLRIVLALLLLPLVGGAARGAPKTVLTTVNFLEDLASRILKGTNYEVHSLMGAGVDPHLYRMTTGDLKKLRSADIILAVGLHLEGKIQESLIDLSKKKSVVFVGNDLPHERLFSTDPTSHTFDPHIWFDPELWKMVAENLGKYFASQLPTEPTITQNTKDLVDSIEKTARELKKKSLLIPKEKRVLITSHDAFRYFGRYFDFQVEGILGVSTDSEVGIRRIQDLSQLIKKQKLRSIFIENSVPPATIEGLREASGCEIGGLLYGDSLGNKDSPAGNYEGMLRHNIESIVEGLK